LKIVPSAANLGELGSQQGQAATFDWKWYFSAAGTLIWLALILALLAPRANHNLHVLWILVPLAIVNLAWLAFKKLLSMPSSATSQFDALFQSMVVGTAALWLTANYLQRIGGRVRFLACLGILAVVACLGILSYSMESSREAPLFFTLLLLLGLAMLGAITLSRRLCGGKYRPVRFMLWLLLWTLLGSSVALGGSILVTSLVLFGGPGFPEVILIVFMVGSILGLCLYVLNLPFMLLGFAHPFFRQRFCACLGLQLVPASGGLASQTGTADSAQVPPLCGENQQSEGK